ncbi:MAG: S23 ribosomal protein [uncultured bacterium]|nr:MAG: S23 ribosomal protein [uncultured bacterium]
MNTGGKENPLYIKADLLAKEIYKVTKDFPSHELYGMTSQLRRAGLSVILNIVEGFARIGEKEYKHFLRISFGSLKETKYLLQFSLEQGYMNELQYKNLYELSEEVAKILWTTMKRLSE